MKGRAIAGLVLALGFAAPASSEGLVAVLSTDQVSIASNFTGANISVFGVVKPDAAKGEVPAAAGEAATSGAYDVVVTVLGPRGSVFVRQKKRLGPLWFNLESRKYIAVPAFAAVLSDRDLDDVAPAATRRNDLIGLETLIAPQGDRTHTTDTDESAFRGAILRVRRAQGLFTQNFVGVRFLAPNVFMAGVDMPGAVPLGVYTVDVAVFSGGVPVARRMLHFVVSKIGAQEAIAAFARSQGFWYGLFTIAVALLFGCAASLIFRRD